METTIPSLSVEQIQERINLCRAELAEWKRALRAVRAVKKAEQARQARESAPKGKGAGHAR
jgi:hypothetical protein